MRIALPSLSYPKPGICSYTPSKTQTPLEKIVTPAKGCHIFLCQCKSYTNLPAFFNVVQPCFRNPLSVLSRYPSQQSLSYSRHGSPTGTVSIFLRNRLSRQIALSDSLFDFMKHAPLFSNSHPQSCLKTIPRRSFIERSLIPSLYRLGIVRLIVVIGHFTFPRD